jgi:hypothetical protein
MFNRRATRTIFATLALAGMVLLGGCGNLSRQPLGPDRAAVAQQGSSGNASVSPKAAKVIARTDTSSQVSVKVKGSTSQTGVKVQISPLSSYSLGDDLVPEGGLP